VYIAEQEILIVAASLVVHCCAMTKNIVLHHSYTMLSMYSSH